MKGIKTLLLLVLLSADMSIEASWSEPSSTNKPWTRWWWHGSAVEKEELTRELESFAKAGFGGVEITPIYSKSPWAPSGKGTTPVTTLADNRIRYMDRNGIPWRILKDINFVDVEYQSFDASEWPFSPYGLRGPVRLLAH